MKTSTKAFTVQSHFAGKDPAVRKIYDRLLKASGRFGPVKEEPRKTSIHLVNKTAFAGVATRKSALVLTIKSDQKLQSADSQIRADLNPAVPSRSETDRAGGS